MSPSSNQPWQSKKVKLALAQFAMTASPNENLDKALKFIAQSAENKADIVCLPELFRSPYFCIHEKSKIDYSEPLPGELVPALTKAAKQYNIAIVGGSIYEKAADGKLFNTAVVINREGTSLGYYRKMHIPHDPAFYECNYFAQGDMGYKVFDLGVAKVAVLICYDQWFPEAARSAALAGAQIIFYPTAIGTVDDSPQVEGNWQEAWEGVQRGHAIANSVVVAAVNRVGKEESSNFWGGSFVSDAFGKILVRGDNTERLLLAEVDLGHSDFTRDSWRFMVSRRPATYTALTKG